MSEGGDLRQAARQGRRALRRTLPPAISERLIRGTRFTATPDRIYAVTGLIAEIAISLRSAFSVSGESVRDRILKLHRFFETGAIEDVRHDVRLNRYRGLLHIVRRHKDDRLRKLLYQAVDVLSERLTMTRYRDEEHRRRHARALLIEPAMWANVSWRPLSAHAGPELDEFGDLLLRFADLLNHEHHAALGRNRIAIDPGGGFGGFFAMAEPTAQFDPALYEQLLERFAQSLDSFAERVRRRDIEHQFNRYVRSPIVEAIHHRREHGVWPPDLRFPGLEAALSSGSWWGRMKERILS